MALLRARSREKRNRSNVHWKVVKMCIGSIEDGGNRKPNEALSIWHWNFYSISPHNFAKLYLLKHMWQLTNLSLSETYLHSSIRFDDNNLETLGYNLIPLDRPSNRKRGGVCIYYKNFLPLRVCQMSFLDECINFELKICDKPCRFVSLYRSPSLFVCLFVCLFIFRFLEHKYNFNIKTYNICHVK